MDSAASVIGRHRRTRVNRGPPVVCWFEECRKDSVPLVGGKCASLGELINAGVRVPPGFALTTEGYRRFMQRRGSSARSKSLLAGVDAEDHDALEKASAQHPRGDRGAAFLHRDGGPDRRVLPQAGGALLHAGGAGGRALERDRRGPGRRQLRRPAGHFLWIRGVDDVLRHMRRCISSLYTGGRSPTAPARLRRRPGGDQRRGAEDGQFLHRRRDVHHPSGQRRSLGDRHRLELRFRRIGRLGRGDAGSFRREQDHPGHHRPHDLAERDLLHGRSDDADLARDGSAVRAAEGAVADRRRDHRAGLDGQADRETLRLPDGHRMGGRQGPARGRQHLHPAGAPRNGMEREEPARSPKVPAARRWTTSCPACWPARR